MCLWFIQIPAERQYHNVWVWNHSASTCYSNVLQSKFITCPYTENPTNSKSMSSPRLHWSFVPSTISTTSEGSVRENNSVHIYITAHYWYTIIQIGEKLYAEVLHECVGVSREKILHKSAIPHLIALPYGQRQIYDNLCYTKINCAIDSDLLQPTRCANMAQWQAGVHTIESHIEKTAMWRVWSVTLLHMLRSITHMHTYKSHHSNISQYVFQVKKCRDKLCFYPFRPTQQLHLDQDKKR